MARQDWQIVHLLLAESAALNLISSETDAPLHQAVRFNQPALVTTFLAKGAKLELKTKEGRTALQLAVKARNLVIVKILLDAGANALTHDHQDKTIFIDLMEDGRFEEAEKTIAEALLAQAPFGFDSYLMYIGYPKSIEDEISFLAQERHGKNAHIYLIDNSSALYYFCLNNTFQKLEKIDQKPEKEKNIQDVIQRLKKQYPNQKNTHFFKLSTENVQDIISNTGHTLPLLVDTADSKENRALHWAVMQLKNKKMIEWLVQKGASLCLRNEKGYSPLHMAVIANELDILRYLLSQPTQNLAVNTQDEQGLTPLHWAAKEGYHDIAQCLLESSADPHRVCQQGKTALQWAIEKRQLSIVNTFICVYQAQKKSLPDEVVVSVHEILLAGIKGKDCINWSYCQIGDEMVSKLVRLLQYQDHTALKKLNLAHNDITHSGAITLAEFLRAHPARYQT
jgi:ankyrin repeat protein